MILYITYIRLIMNHENTSMIHKKSAPRSARFAVITVSTSRFETFGNSPDPEHSDDISGKLMIELLKSSGHEVTRYSLLPDNKDEIAQLVSGLSDSDINAIVISGGTGLASDDVTLEAVEPLFNKTIPGFGELFRQKSLNEVGTAAMLSRASAGIVNKCIVFCLPGSPAAVKLGINELVIPEVTHIIKHVASQ
jgi:molybdenum cofactor biosynthesis protein B